MDLLIGLFDKKVDMMGTGLTHYRKKLISSVDKNQTIQLLMLLTILLYSAEKKMNFHYLEK